MEKGLSRRRFLQWGGAVAGAGALTGFTACKPETTPEPQPGEPEIPVETGTWLTGACMNNCSCESSRCLLKVYVEDGVPLKIRSDEDEEDSIFMPQRRACPRGRSQISNITGPARIKYPMKRKHFSIEDPHGELRGIDEWERLSWDEALDLAAKAMQRIYDTYGSRSILACALDASGQNGYTYFDPFVCLLNAKGGAIHHDMGTQSIGAWAHVESFMTGGCMFAPDVVTRSAAQLYFHFGNNWAANKAGNTTWLLQQAKANGARIVIVEPWLNQTASAIADEWVPILPGSDTAFVLGMCYHQIVNNLQNQAFLDKYCSGFDAEHMPDFADPRDNFKDYVLGTYDGEPKTPEWAEKICGVPAATTRRLAEEIASTECVDFFAGQSTTKVPSGEMFGQAFYTLAFMHGVGTPGNTVSWTGFHENNFNYAGKYVSAGDAANGKGLNPVNGEKPPCIILTPDWTTIQDQDSWLWIDNTECWQSILDGEEGRDSWPGGKKKLDIHMIYAGGYENALNSVCNANAGIKVFRKMDFVLGVNPYFDASRRYCDIVLPASTWWEKASANVAYNVTSETLYWSDHIMDPLYESKSENWITEEMAKRLGIDPKSVNTMTDAERQYYSLAGATKMSSQTQFTFEPLFTITQEDLDEMGVEGTPQQGSITIKEFKEKGIYKVRREAEDDLSFLPYAGFVYDPEQYPLMTQSGKFEIYCPTLAWASSLFGYTTVYPIAKWQIADPEQGPGTQTDEYPLLLWTPHSLRRAHTVNDNVVSLREAFPQECFMSTVDAEARGIKNGDPVLMTSPYGKVLRPAKVLPTIVPGAVALQDGGWINIDEETGIDLGGCPNILQAPKGSSGGVQCWTGTLVQVEKYTGPLTLGPDKNTPIVMPLGIE